MICRVPVTASVNVTSTLGLVSKLSDKLQQAALRSSSSCMVSNFIGFTYAMPFDFKRTILVGSCFPGSTKPVNIGTNQLYCPVIFCF